jgi:Uma2 family endonuclease
MSSARRKPDTDPPLMTADEFFDMPDDGTGNKYELVDGALVAMAPTHATHGRLQGKLAYLIYAHLDVTGSKCWMATEIGVKPELKGKTNVRVPDLGVSCRPQMPGEKPMPEPNLLVEILSPSTARADQAKVWLYATMPSVREILIVHTTKVRLELYARLADGSWPNEAQLAMQGDSVDISCIGMQLHVDKLYQDIVLAS